MFWAQRSFQNHHQTFHDRCPEKIGPLPKKSDHWSTRTCPENIRPAPTWLTHCGLWRSRRRFTHSVVVVVAHSRQCSVICCMHSAGNVTSPLCCTCELIRDAHCLISSRAVAWPDGGRRTYDDSTTIIYWLIYWRVRESMITSGVRFNGF